MYLKRCYMERIEREEYLEFLKNHKDKQIIKDKYK